jgi:hypothetical protein
MSYESCWKVKELGGCSRCNMLYKYSSIHGLLFEFVQIKLHQSLLDLVLLFTWYNFCFIVSTDYSKETI